MIKIVLVNISDEVKKEIQKKGIGVFEQVEVRNINEANQVKNNTIIFYQVENINSLDKKDFIDGKNYFIFINDGQIQSEGIELENVHILPTDSYPNEFEILRSYKESSRLICGIDSILNHNLRKTNIDDLKAVMNSYLESSKEVKDIQFVQINSNEDSLYDISKFQALNKNNRVMVINKPNDNEICVLLLEGYSSKVYVTFKIKVSELNTVLNSTFFQFIENFNYCHILNHQVKSLAVLASTDEVTGLFNQRQLATDLEDAIQKHEQEHDTFSIMFIDVDHFKNVNDNYGHIIGSKLLLDLGKALKLILRDSDHIYRYGGDEFVIIMPHVKIGFVHDIASRVLKQLKSHEFDINNGETYKMSISIGIAEYPTDAKSAMEIIQFADEMMYKSKQSGRGRVFHVKEVANVDASSK